MNEDQPYFPQAVTLEEAWVRARNTWTLAQRHGTLEEGDLMAVGELRRHVKLIDEGGVPLDVVNKAINAAVADASNGARQTAEYWKAEHLAGNERIAMLETSNAHFTERIIELEADLAAAQAVLPCGHHNSLMLKSAETGEPLYCEYCDCIQRRNDAEKMERDLKLEIYNLKADKSQTLMEAERAMAQIREVNLKMWAERDALRKAWECAKRQNAHDMLLSGDEIHQHDAAIYAARKEQP